MSKDSILWGGDHTSRRQTVHMDSHLYTRFLLQSNMKRHFKTSIHLQKPRVSWYMWMPTLHATGAPGQQVFRKPNPAQPGIQDVARSYPSVIFSMMCFLLCAICCLLHGSCNMICSVWRLLLLFFFGLCILAVNCYLCFYFPTMLKRTITFIQRRMLGAWNTNGPPSLLCLASREGTPSAASASIVWSLENVCKITWKSYTEYTGYTNHYIYNTHIYIHIYIFTCISYLIESSLILCIES